MGTNHYLLFRLAAGQQADHLKNLKDRSPLIGSQIAYYYNTHLGPAGATIGYSNHTKQVYFYLNLGYDF